MSLLKKTQHPALKYSGGVLSGFLLTLCSVPLTLGPLVAGAIYDYTGKD
jgi:hypothetical protein